MRSFWYDARYGLRLLSGSPGLTAVAILTLALGIGASTAVFGLVDQAALEPLPVKNPRGLVQMTLLWPSGSESSNLDYPEFRPLVEDRRSFSGMFVYAERTSNMQWGRRSARAHTLLVSGSFYSVLGVRPFLGRLIEPGDDQASVPRVAALSYSFWQSRFGGSGSALGQTVYLEGVAFTVVGITPPSFFGLSRLWTPDVTVPLRSMPTPGSVYCVGRLKPNVTQASALAELGITLQSSLAGMSGEMEKWPARERRETRGLKVGLIPAGVGDWGMSLELSEVLPILMVSVSVLLLVACTNLAGFQLARQAGRVTELKIRMALGASRWRVMRQLMTEGVLLSAAGGLFGILVAFGASKLLIGLLPLESPADVGFPLDSGVFAFAAAACALTVVLASGFPAWLVTRARKQRPLIGGADAGPRSTGQRWARGLLAAQLASSMALLAGAGLLARTLYNLGTVNPGFRSSHLLLFNIDSSDADLQGSAASRMEDALLRRVRALPSVRSAALALSPLFGRAGVQKDIWVEGFSYGQAENHMVAFNSVSPGFFATMGFRSSSAETFGRGTAPIPLVSPSSTRRSLGSFSREGTRLEGVSGMKARVPRVSTRSSGWSGTPSIGTCGKRLAPRSSSCSARRILAGPSFCTYARRPARRGSQPL